MKKKGMLLVGCTSLLLLNGCAPGAKYFNETGDGTRASLLSSLPAERTGDPGNIDKLRRNVGHLATEYINSYSEYQKANFGTNAILIGIGLTGIGVASFSPPIDLIKGLAIGAGTTAAYQNFAITGKPESFIKANKSLVCVQDALSELDSLGTDSGNSAYLFAGRLKELENTENPDLESVYQKGLISNSVLVKSPNKVIETVDTIVYRSMTEFWTTKSNDDILNEAKSNIESALSRKIESKNSSENANITSKIANATRQPITMAKATTPTSFDQKVEVAKIVANEITLISNYESKLSSCLLIQ